MAPPTFSIVLHLEDPFQGAELGVRNEPEEINRLLIQTNELNSQAIFKTELQRVSYGYLLPDKALAALIVFQSQFHFSSRNRITQATVRLALADTVEPTNPQKAPRIIKIAPLWHRGGPAVRSTSSSTSVGASLNDGSVIAAGLRSDTTSERHQTRYAETKGIIASHHSRKHPTIMNRAIWSTEENSVQQAGIPPFFRAAILVRYEGPFQMAMEVDVVQGFTNSILRFLRRSARVKDVDDPVYFTPGKPYPSHARHSEDLGKTELEELVELPVPKPLPGV